MTSGLRSVTFSSPSSLKGRLRAPGSKSYTHRAYLTAVTHQGGRIHHPLRSEDTEATRRCLHGFRGDVRNRDHRVDVETDGPSAIQKDEFQAGESGTLFRFLLPLCSLLPGPEEVVINGEGSLLDRSHGEVIDSLRQNDLRIDYVDRDGYAPVRCYPGQTLSSDLHLRATTTSQHVSGALIALSASGGGTLIVNTDLVSAPYVTMTRSVLEKAGTTIEKPGPGEFRVTSPENGEPFEYDVPGDYSSAAFPLVGALLTGGRVEVEGLIEDDVQADRHILTILRSLGGDVQWSGNTVELRGFEDERPPGFTVDASRCPDLVPILAVLGSFARSQVVIENIAHLRNKESNRIDRPCEALRSLGVTIEGFEDRIEITPSAGSYPGGEVRAYNDHRLAMAFSVFGAVNGSVTVHGVDCVDKSYPTFYEDLRQLDVSFNSHTD